MPPIGILIDERAFLLAGRRSLATNLRPMGLDAASPSEHEGRLRMMNSNAYTSSYCVAGHACSKAHEAREPNGKSGTDKI